MYGAARVSGADKRMGEAGLPGRIGAYDGLRALACLAVIGFHAQAPGLGAGWVGVDAFFVLSGFLITGLLLAERESTHRIKLVRFWLRRAGRLYPALLVLVLAGIPFARQLGDQTHGYVLTATLALAYLTDLWLGSGMGTGGAFGLTWSLAIEEQFYVLWPLVLSLVRSRRAVLYFSVTVACCSFAAMLTTAQHEVWNRPEAYFLPQTRFWELLIGCALAATAHRLPTGRSACVAAWTGAAIASVPFLINDLGIRSGSRQQTMALEMVPTVAATALLIVGATGADTWVSRALGWGPLVWIGRRSYGAYLYQVPVLLLLPHSPVPLPSPVVFALAAATSLAAAALSFRYVEEPVRMAVNRRLATGRWPSIRTDLRASRPFPTAVTCRDETSPELAQPDWGSQ
jgi:peptidoglycan/LPS O-acetylase OafA/YrhL